MELNANEKDRYARQLVLKDIGIKGQLKLKAAKIFVVGAGGLGSSLLLYLSAAGIGNIVIIDGDQVQSNNLQRQVIFKHKQIGNNKAKIAAQNLRDLNEMVDIAAIPAFLNEENINDILQANSLIADCSDNYKTRYLINDYAIKNNCTLVSAAIYKHQIQFGVFNFPYEVNKRSATFSCAFPEEKNSTFEDTCASTGVLGLTPGIGGMLIANEIIKVITLSNQVQYNKIMVLDMHDLSLKHWTIKRKVSI